MFHRLLNASLFGEKSDIIYECARFGRTRFQHVCVVWNRDPSKPRKYLFKIWFNYSYRSARNFDISQIINLNNESMPDLHIHGPLWPFIPQSAICMRHNENTVFLQSKSKSAYYYEYYVENSNVGFEFPRKAPSTNANALHARFVVEIDVKLMHLYMQYRILEFGCVKNGLDY